MALHLSLQSVYFSYPESTSSVIEDLSVDLRSGWYGLSGSNGGGKTTLLKLISGVLKPDSGMVSAPVATFCPQETDRVPPEQDDFMAALYDGDKSAGKLFSLLELDHDWPYRRETLSHGEKKRFQLAVALWRDRPLLMVDEPTNHLDVASRNLVLSALLQNSGIGIVVSHDRDFMDRLCRKNLFLRNGTVKLRPGRLSEGLAQERLERETLVSRHRQVARDLRRLEREAAQRRVLAEGQQRRRSKRGLDLKDHDARFKKNAARVSGKDGTGGKLLRQMDGRLQQVRGTLEGIAPEARAKTGVTQLGAHYRGDRILYLAEGELSLGEKSLVHPELVLAAGSRMALTGANGSGKTSLIKRLLSDCPVRERVLYLEQEPTEELRERFRGRFEGLNDADRGRVVSYFSRLGGNPDGLLPLKALSPGEWRKLMLAFGLTEEPALIILDEPTNHLDVTSIECLEDTLREAPCALLIVSHDRRFREALTGKEWRIEEGKLVL